MAESGYLRLLLVEDDPDYAFVLSRMLGRSRRLAGQLAQVTTLGQALEGLAAGKRDLVLLDLNLPDSLGLDTLDALRRADPDAALVVITGEGDEDLGRQALSHGAQDYLLKSDITPALLHRALLYALERKQAEQSQVRALRELEEQVQARTQDLGAVNRRLKDLLARRLKMERDLQRSEDRYRRIVTTANEGIWIIDEHYRTSFANAKMAQLLGCRLVELMDSSALDFAPPGRRDDLQRALEERRSGVFEFPWRRLDGSLLWSLTSTTPLLDQQGRYEGALGMVTDISRRKEAEVRLRESEGRLRFISENISDTIWRTDADLNITYISPAVRRRLGLGPEDLIGKFALEHLPPQSQAKIMDALAATLASDPQGNPSGAVTIPQVTPFGEQVWVEIQATVLRDDQGEFQGLVGISRDVTARRRAEEALRRSEERFRVLVETSGDMIWETDAEGVFTYVSPRCRDILGYHAEELIGSGPCDLMPQEEAGRMRKLLGGISRQGLPIKAVENHSRRKDGSPVVLEISGLPFFDQEGGLLGYRGVDRDVTERKQWEDRLVEAKDKAEAATASKSRFLATMSHEIRTPMNGVQGMLELALETDLTQEQRDFLETAKASAHSLLALINDILDLSKIEAGRMDLEEMDFGLRDSLGDALRPLALAAHAKGLELNYSISAATPDVLWGDPGRLRQIVTNLVGNAIKFTEQGEVTLSVQSVQQEPDGVELKVEVRDTGVGIPLKAQQSIFEAFNQADSSVTRRFGGTGLGLAICRQLCRMMGGSMWLQSEPGQGSAFFCTLRLGLGQGPLTRPLPAPPQHLRGLRALVVDDNPTNLRILCHLLEDKGMVAVPAEGASQALALMRTKGHPLALALIDANMPHMDGFDLAERLRSDPAWADLPLIMLTSSGQRGDAARCRSLGVAGYLIKPVSERELWHTLRAVWGERRSLPEKPTLVTRHYLRERGHSLNILLAEDNKINQKVAMAMLGKRGHRVTLADNGQEALGRLEEGGYDLVLMDVEMPIMDGLTATRLIREKEDPDADRLPIIALTAHAMSGDRERFIAAGMDDYLAKPIDLAKLDAKLASLHPRLASAEG